MFMASIFLFAVKVAKPPETVLSVADAADRSQRRCKDELCDAFADSIYEFVKKGSVTAPGGLTHAEEHCLEGDRSACVHCLPIVPVYSGFLILDQTPLKPPCPAPQ